MIYTQPFHPGSIQHNRFLVTGGAGFIGSNIVEYLITHGAEKVTVLDNLSTGFEVNIQPYLGLPNFEFIKGDICDFDTCQKAARGVQYVFHQAALGSVPRSVKDPITTNKVNVDGFLNILVAARDQGVKRLVYASSSSVYGDQPDSPKLESIIGNALSPYAVTKRTNELYANVFAETYGIEVIGLRYFNIFGPRQSPTGEYAAAIPLFMDALLCQKPAFINGDGLQSRDFTFVANAVQANIKAMFTKQGGAIGQVYNIAVGEKKSIKDLYFLLQGFAESKQEPIYRENRKGDIRDSLASIEKAEKLLGYAPTHRLESGLRITFDWFKSVYYPHK